VKKTLGTVIENLFDGWLAQVAALDEALGQLILEKGAAVGKIGGADDEVVAKFARDIEWVVVEGAGDENSLGKPAVDLDAIRSERGDVSGHSLTRLGFRQRADSRLHIVEQVVELAGCRYRAGHGGMRGDELQEKLRPTLATDFSSPRRQWLAAHFAE
jgi:hypothetical protein